MRVYRVGDSCLYRTFRGRAREHAQASSIRFIGCVTRVYCVENVRRPGHQAGGGENGM